VRFAAYPKSGTEGRGQRGRGTAQSRGAEVAIADRFTSTTANRCTTSALTALRCSVESPQDARREFLSSRRPWEFIRCRNRWRLASASFKVPADIRDARDDDQRLVNLTTNAPHVANVRRDSSLENTVEQTRSSCRSNDQNPFALSKPTSAKSSRIGLFSCPKDHPPGT